jgi:hypothetical protein
LSDHESSGALFEASWVRDVGVQDRRADSHELSIGMSGVKGHGISNSASWAFSFGQLERDFGKVGNKNKACARQGLGRGLPSITSARHDTSWIGPLSRTHNT